MPCQSKEGKARLKPPPLVYRYKPFADSSPRQVRAKNDRRNPSNVPYAGKAMTDNAWYFWGITIVLLDSFQICVNNNFVLEVIYRDSG